MPTLIRASQLHPDISGLVYKYTTGLYPEFHTYSGVDGIDVISGAGNVGLLSAKRILNSGIVNSVNGLSGALNITGLSGISVIKSGNYLHLNYTGGMVSSVNSLSGPIAISGQGDITVLKSGASTLFISGKRVTGLGGVSTYESGGNVYVDGRRLVYSLNLASGDVTILGSGGVIITRSGQYITIDATNAANSGIMSVNGQKGNISVSGYNDLAFDSRAIESLWDPVYRTIWISNKSNGWGTDNVPDPINSTNQVYIGDDNSSTNSYDAFVNGYQNYVTYSTGLAIINGLNNETNYTKQSSLVNCSGVNVDNILGATIINGRNTELVRPFSLNVGFSIPRTSYEILAMRSVSTGDAIKFLKIPGTSQYGINVPTGCVILGQMDYAFLESNMTDFWANFDVKSNGAYGRKHFVMQRNNAEQVEIKDESDFFGGSNIYNVSLSGGSDGCFYVFSSGISGISYTTQATFQFSQLSFQDFKYSGDAY